MNERIRELAEKASIDCELVEQWARDSAYIWTATDDELAKFAELIIEEQPKREWVGLTDEEHAVLYVESEGLHPWAKAIEAKLKEKNT